MHVKVSSDSQCSRTHQSLSQLRMHNVIVKEICAMIGFGRSCVESIDSDQRQNIVSNYDTHTPKHG